jgi:hypothetical protein
VGRKAVSYVAFLAYGIFMALAIVSFFAGVAYLAGGRMAVAKQANAFLALGAGLVALFASGPLWSTGIGAIGSTILLLVVAGLILWNVRTRLPRSGSLLTERQRAALDSGAFRWLVVGFVVASVVATVLLILSARV